MQTKKVATIRQRINFLTTNCGCGSNYKTKQIKARTFSIAFLSIITNNFRSYRNKMHTRVRHSVENYTAVVEKVILPRESITGIQYCLGIMQKLSIIDIARVDG